MEQKTIGVPAIHCQHCVMQIKREVGAIAGVAEVAADAASHQVTVRWQAPATWSAIRSALVEIGFAPAE